MEFCTAKHVLRDLDDLDIDNLIAGRFTKDAINVAVRRIRKNYDISDVFGSSQIASGNERILADELNDMLEAAKMIGDKKYGR